MPAGEVFHIQITAAGSSSVKREAAESNGALSTVGKTAGVTTGRLAALAKGAAIVGVAVAAASVKLATDFNQSMTLVHTQAGATSQEVANLRGEVLALSKASEFSPNELAGGLFRVESAGFHGAQALHVLTEATHLAEVGQADLEATTYAVTAAMRSGIKGTEDAAKVVGVLNAAVGQGNMRMEDLTAALSTGVLPSARAFGLGLTDVTSAIDIFTRAGTPAQAAATRLRMTFSLLGAPTDKAQSELASIGLSATSLAEDMRKPQGLLVALTDLKSHLEDSGLSAVQQAQLISAAFGGGRTSSGILTLLQNTDQLGEVYQATGERAKDFGRLVEEQSETPAAKFHRALNTIQVDLIEMGAVITPVVASLATVGAGLVDTISSLPGPVQTGTVALALMAYPAIKLTQGMIAMRGAFIEARTAMIAFFGVEALAAISMEQLGVLGVLMAQRLVAGLATAIPVALAAAGIVNIMSSVLSGDREGGAFKIGGALAGGIAGGMAFGLPGALAGAGIGSILGGVVRHLFDNIFGGAGPDLSPLQRSLAESSHRVAASLQAERGAIAGYAGASKQLVSARAREHKSTIAIHQAEKGLLSARKRYGPDSRQATQAEIRLANAKVHDKNATAELRAAERVHGAQRKALMAVLRSANAVEIQRIGLLRQEQTNIRNHILAMTREGASAKDIAAEGAKWRGVLQQLRGAQAQHNKTLNDAATKIGPKFFQSLKHVTELQATFGSKTKQQAKGIADSIAAPTGKVRDLGNAFQSTSQRAANNLRRMTGASQTFARAVYLGDQSVVTNTASVARGFGAPFPAIGLQPPGGKQTGGFAGKVPGSGSGDKVLLQAAVEPHEGIFVMNRNAMGALQAWNDSYPRFQQGGIHVGHPRATGQGPMRGVAQGAIDDAFRAAQKWVKSHGPVNKMIGAGNRAAAQHFPYVYGGGHGGFGLQPTDCSGLVSYVLHAGGFLSSPVTTDGLKTFGLPGPGKQVTIGVRGSSGRSAHTMMLVGNTGFESGGSGGGAHVQPSWDGVFPIKRHPPGLQAGGEVLVAKQVLAAMKHSRREGLVFDPASPDFVGWGLQGGGEVRYGRYLKHGDHWLHPHNPLNPNEGHTLLWQSGLSDSDAGKLTTVLPDESHGRWDADNPHSDAFGVWQILGRPTGGPAGSLGNPIVNSIDAAIKWRTEGPGAWPTYPGSGPQGHILRARIVSPKKHPKMKGSSGGVLPKRFQGRIDALTSQADIAADRADRADQLGGPVLGRSMMDWLLEELNALFALRNVIIAALGWLASEIEAARKAGKAGKGKKGAGKANTRLGALTGEQSTLAGQLEEIQGKGAPGGILKKLPAIDVLGGRIFDVRNTMREGGVSDAGGDTTDDSAELLKQLLLEAHLRELVALRQYPVLSRIPGLMGGFAGGRAGGPGGWALVGERGMEIAKLATGGPVVNNEGTEAFRQLVSETGASGGGDAVHVVEPHVHLEGDLHTDGRPLEEAVTVSFREYTRKAASTARRRTRP